MAIAELVVVQNEMVPVQKSTPTDDVFAERARELFASVVEKEQSGLVLRKIVRIEHLNCTRVHPGGKCWFNYLPRNNDLGPCLLGSTCNEIVEICDDETEAAEIIESFLLGNRWAWRVHPGLTLRNPRNEGSSHKEWRERGTY